MDYNNTKTIEQNYSCILPYEISEEQWNLSESFAWWLDGFSSVVIGFVGIILNVTSIVVLWGSDLAASFFNWLLVCLAMFDILFLLSGILEAFRGHILAESTALYNQLFVHFLFPFRSIVMCCSIYMTVILALERYNAFKRPLSSRKNSVRQQNLKSYFFSNWRRVMKYVGPIVVFSTLFYIPKWFELQLTQQKNVSNINVVESNDSMKEIIVELTELRKNNQYSLWYLNVANPLITALFPLMALAYLNINIYCEFKRYLRRQPSFAGLTMAAGIADRHVQRRIRKRERELVQQTTVLFAIVVLFVLFHVLRIILNIEELDSLYRVRHAREIGCEWLQFWTLIAVPISNSLLQINSSINFFIYCVFNKSFRDTLKSKLPWLFRDPINMDNTTSQKMCKTEMNEANQMHNGNHKNEDNSVIAEMNGKKTQTDV